MSSQKYPIKRAEWIKKVSDKLRGNRSGNRYLRFFDSDVDVQNISKT